jgi:hypothetical protein
MIPWAAMLVAIALSGYVRLRLLQVPLERDEGEYAYAGQLMLQGVPPYALARNMKLPGAYAAYAAIMRVFGESIRGVHLGLMLANAAAALLMFLLGRRLFGARGGVAACAAYAVMSVGEGVMGTQAHATHFVVLPALGGVLLLLRATDTGRIHLLFWSGLLFGLGCLAKQHGVFFGVFGALWLMWIYRRRAWGRLAVFGAAMLLPFGATCLVLWRAGVFRQFWFWTFTYARAYVMEDPFSGAAARLWDSARPLLTENAGLWLLALAGLALVWRRRKTNAEAALVTTGLLVFSLAATAPGFYFRAHYFVMVLPAAALLAGAVAANGRTAAAWLFAGALAFSFIWQKEPMFRMTPVQVSRDLYGTSPFPEAIRVAAYIRDHTASGAQIAVLGSEPEIYFYARRRSATAYLYMYPLTEEQPYAPTMQQEMIREVEEQRPEYAVFVHAEGSWLTDFDEPEPVLDWWAEYRRNYDLVGVADIVSEERTEYRWGAEAPGYTPQGDDYLLVYRRREAKSAGLRQSVRTGAPVHGETLSGRQLLEPPDGRPESGPRS